MPRFITLDSTQGFPIHINVEHIVVFFPKSVTRAGITENYTSITVSTGFGGVEVKQSSSEILQLINESEVA